MIGPSARARLADKIAGLREAALESVAFRAAALDALRSVVPFDAFVWLMTDPETAVGSAPLAQVPCAAELPTLIKLKYLTPVNRWTHLASSGGAASLDRATAHEPSRSLVWRELLARYAISDVASLACVDRFGCWAFLDLWRQGARVFSLEELGLLAEIAPALTQALRECQLRTFETPPRSADRDLGPAVLLLDDDLSLVDRTPAADLWSRMLIGTRSDADPIPAAAYNVSAQLLALEAGVSDSRALARVHLTGGLWLTFGAARLTGRRDRPTIAVTIEETSPIDRITVYARAAGLSRRERELLQLLAEGADTHEAASRLAVSENTVQDHLKSIFAKTHTNSRRATLSRALGTRAPPPRPGGTPRT